MATRRAFVVAALLAGACHRAPSSQLEAAAKTPVLSEPSKQAAFRDLQQGLVAVRAAVANHLSPVYAADKLMLAAKELDGEHDAGVLKLLAEAETVYGHDAPVAWAETKMKEAEATPAARGDDCKTVREQLDRVSGKYKDEAAVLALAKRYKALCPRVRPARSSSGGSSSGGSSSAGGAGPNRAQQRDDCRRRCDDAAFDCRSRCVCGVCTTDKTWDQCNAACNSCKQGCEQNERFCRSSCGD